MRTSYSLALLLTVSLATGSCVARGGVPRPFPGAALPPTAAPSEPVPDSPPRAVPERAEAPVAEPVDALPAPSLVGTALALRGIPYRYGGRDPSGFDCSGFVQYVFAKNGLALPREVRDQYRTGREIRLYEVEAGDLLFFETVTRGASHVGMAIGGGRFVHAPSSWGVVRVESYRASYWARRFVGAKRVR